MLNKVKLYQIVLLTGEDWSFPTAHHEFQKYMLKVCLVMLACITASQHYKLHISCLYTFKHVVFSFKIPKQALAPV